MNSVVQHFGNPLEKMFTMSFATRWAAFLAATLGCLIVTLGCLTLWGCSSGNPAVIGPKNNTAKKKDDLDLARELYRTATEAPQFRDANDRTNNLLAGNAEALSRHYPGTRDKSKLQLLLNKHAKIEVEKLDDRGLYQKFLEEIVGLDKAEIEEVESPSFTLTDAHYLEECFLLREVVRSLVVESMTPLEQVEVCWRWVMRHVVLHQSRDELLPPQFVLMRGQGSAVERAAVFMALIQQLTAAPAAEVSHFDGCLIGLPGQNGQIRPWLVGVLIATKEQEEMYLFDPRLGVPVPGPKGKGIATLAQLQSDPTMVLDRFKVADAVGKYDVDAEQASQAAVYLTCPMASLSARMRYLQDDLLYGFDRINLACRAADLTVQLEKDNKKPVKFWSPAPAKIGLYPQTPTRAWRLCLTPDEGGIDKSNRVQTLMTQLIPWPAILRAYDAQKLSRADLDIADAQDKLQILARQIWVHYCVKSEQELVRGRLDDCTKRLVRIQRAVHEAKDRQTDAADVAAWRKRVSKAYESGNPAKVVEIWSEDQWLDQLVSNPNEEPANPKEMPRTILSDIVLRAVSEPVQSQCDYLLALRWQEKAERLRAEGVKQGGGQAWDNANLWWGRFAQDIPLSLDSVRTRLEMIKEHSKGSWVYFGAGPVQQYGKAVRQAAAGRFLDAQALRQLGKTDAAAAVLRALVEDLAALEKEAQYQRPQWASFLNSYPPPLRVGVDATFADLSPGGSLSWLRFAAGLALAELGRR